MKLWPFFELVRRESSLSIPKLALTGGAAGLSNALVLSIVNGAASNIERNDAGVQNFVLFCLVIALYVVAQTSLMLTATHGVETMVHHIRTRIGAQIAACELATLEKVGRGGLYSAVSRDTQIISQSTVTTVIGIQFGILLVFTTIYIAILSLTAFALVVAFTVSIGALQVSRRKQLNRDLHAAAKAESHVLELITHLLDGFKEVKMSRARRAELLAQVDTSSLEARNVKAESLSTIAKYFVFSQVSFYLLLGVAVFIMPQISDSYEATITKIAAAILFMMGPVQGLAGAIPQIETANTAAENINKIEGLLAKATADEVEQVETLETFSTVGLADARYTYRDDDGTPVFAVGPASIELRPGEIVFLTGGNGAGKSTLVKLFTSLYPTADGSIVVDGKPLKADAHDAYREQISAVFSDYHLFDRLYGLSAIGDEAANAELAYLGLDRKTSIRDGQFETTKLSGGQRKRLALLTALLEDRPIMLFDEVAADQDPEFRKRYYTEILPALREKGKRLLVITHDDAYFHTADRVIRMDEGHLVEVLPQEPTES